MWIELGPGVLVDADCYIFFEVKKLGEWHIFGRTDCSQVLIYSGKQEEVKEKFEKIRTALLHKFSPIEGADLLLKLIADLTLADHLGDVASSVSIALDMIGLKDIKWGDLTDLGDELGKMGVTTLLGVDMTPEEE